MNYSEKGDREEVRKKNNDLLLKVMERCCKKQVPVVWLFLGLPGAGKSAIVNTLIKALTGTYYHRAVTGSGVAATRTMTLQRYEHCGVLREDFDSSFHRDVVRRHISKLPTIFDAAGMTDIDTEHLQEILEMYIRGFIPPNTAVSFLEKHLEKNGIGCLRKMYKESKPEWRVTKVVFVQACDTDVPENLAACLQSVLTKPDPKTGRLVCPCDVFVVMSKYDMVREKNLTGHDVTMEALEHREKAVADHFSLHGAMKHCSIRWVSYMDDNSDDNPCIDQCALRLLLKLLTHGSVRPTDNENSVMPQLPSEINKVVTGAVLMLLLAILAFFLLPSFLSLNH